MACPVGGLEGCRCAQAPTPGEFRDDVVRLARSRDAGVTVEQIATTSVHPMTLFKWMRAADVDAGVKPGVSSSESAELRQARKRIRYTPTPVSNMDSSP